MKNNIILALICFTIFSCGKTEGITEEKKEISVNEIELSSEQIANLNLQTDTLLKANLPLSISVIGNIDIPPNDITEISLPITARAISMKELLPGKPLEKGEILAEFESYEFLDLQEKYLSVKAELEANLKELDRQKSLLKDQITSQKEFDNINYKVKSNQSILESLRLKLETLNIDINKLNKGEIENTIKIISPFKGNIGMVNITLGKTYNSSTSLVSILKSEHLHAELKVYEKDISSVSKGNKVFIQNLNGEKYLSKVFLIGKTIDPNERFVSVHSHFENEKDQDNFILGQQVNAEIILDNKIQTVIPIEGLIQNGENGYIFSIEGNRIYKNPVSIQGQFKEYISILPNGKINGKIILNQASGIMNIFNQE